MSERLSITPLGPYIGAQISGADLTRPLSDNQFEQLYPRGTAPPGGVSA